MSTTIAHPTAKPRNQCQIERSDNEVRQGGEARQAAAHFDGCSSRYAVGWVDRTMLPAHLALGHTCQTALMCARRPWARDASLSGEVPSAVEVPIACTAACVLLINLTKSSCAVLPRCTLIAASLLQWLTCRRVIGALAAARTLQLVMCTRLLLSALLIDPFSASNLQFVAT